MKQLIAATLMGALTLVTAADAEAAVKAGIAGIMDPETGKFTPNASHMPTPAATGVSGTIALTLTISVEAAIASTTTILCDTDFLDDSSSFVDDVNVVGVTATRSGSTATCKITLPYHWVVSSTTDQVTLSYSVYTNNAGTAGAVSHSFSNTIVFTLPATGSTTTVGQGPSL